MSHCNFLPNVGPGTNYCCAIHDADYDRSGISRHEADRKLRACLRANGNARWRVELAYLLVRLFGWAFYRKRKQ